MERLRLLARMDADSVVGAQQVVGREQPVESCQQPVVARGKLRLTVDGSLDRSLGAYPEHLSRFQIDYQPEFCRLLDRKVGWFGALQDLVDIDSSPAMEIAVGDLVGHQASVISGENPQG